MLIRKALISSIMVIAIVFSILISALPVAAEETQDLAGRVIFLDAGHGIGSGGGSGKYVEHVRMLYLANQIRALLTARGATVHMVRPTEADVQLPARVAYINKTALQAVRQTHTDTSTISDIDRLIGLMNGVINDPKTEGSRLTNTPYDAKKAIHPDLQKVFERLNHQLIRNNYLMISLHSNATSGSADSKERGVQVFYLSPSEHGNTAIYYKGYPYVAQTKAFADSLLNHISGVYYNGNNISRYTTGLRVGNMYMNREVGIPSVYTENGFHTNATDRSLLLNNTYMELLAAAYVNAILEYFRTLPLYVLADDQPPSDSVGENPDEDGSRTVLIADRAKVEQFVTRLYEVVLNRKADIGGHEHWTEYILAGNSASAVAYGFIFSDELASRNLTNDEFVEVLYGTLLGRKSDSEGKTFWVTQINTTATKQAVFASFAISPEFGEICAQYGVRR